MVSVELVFVSVFFVLGRVFFICVVGFVVWRIFWSVRILVFLMGRSVRGGAG